MVRREIGIRPLDIPAAYKRKIRLMNEQRYLELLEPYLKTTFGAVEWPVGYSARILFAVKLHKRAIQQVQDDHGVADQRTKNPDIMKIIEKFAPDPENNVKTWEPKTTTDIATPQDTHGNTECVSCD
jgi:hypothetical protein